MGQIFANNASGVLGAQLSNVATSLTLLDASAFPSPGSDFYLCTLVALNNNGQESAWEIVKVTGKASNTLTIVRAQEGTSAATWPLGSTVQMRVTAGTLDSFTDTNEAAAAAPVQSVAGKTGAVTLTKSDVSLGNVSNDAQLKIASNLSDLDNAATARTNLGLGTAATTAATDYLTPVLSNVAVSGVKTVTFNSQVATSGSSTQTYTIDFATAQKQKLTITGTVTATLAFSYPAVGTYQLMYLPASTVTTVWPTIGASWQWLNATAAPTLNTGTYGGIVTIYWDGALAVASYAKIGAA